MCESNSNSTRPSKAGKFLDTDTWDALKAAGFSEGELQADQPFGPVIFAYTRADAIRDGVLVDLMQPATVGLVREAGFRLPIAMTATAFAETVCPIDDDRFEYPVGQSLNGRLWDVLMVLRFAIRAANRRGDTDRVHFKVSVFDGQKSNTVRLWCQCGPGDDAEPVLTIMLEGED